MEPISELKEQLGSLRLTRDPPRHVRTGHPVLLGGIALGLMAGAAWWVRVITTTPDVPTVGVTRIAPARGRPNVEVTITGYVIAPTTSAVGSPIAGALAEIYVRRGDRVERGDVLFRLEAAEHEASLTQAEARERVAVTRVEAQRTELRHAVRRAEISRILAAEGGIAYAEAQDRDAEVERLQRELATAQAEVAAASADTEASRMTLRQLTVRAPISGTVLEAPSSRGELVGGPLSQPVIHLTDLEHLRVDADLPETRLNVVQLGAPCSISIAAYPQRWIPGRVRALATRVDRAKAALTVEIELLGTDHHVLPGMAARIDVLREHEDPTEHARPVVPTTAIAERDGRLVVFVVVDNLVRAEPVEVGSATGVGIELLNGPPIGTTIVDDIPPTLQDGQQILLRDE